MSTALDQLKQTGTVVVSDSGDFEGEYHDQGDIHQLLHLDISFFASKHTDHNRIAIDVYKPQDATTNPVSNPIGSLFAPGL